MDCSTLQCHALRHTVLHYTALSYDTRHETWHETWQKTAQTPHHTTPHNTPHCTTQYTTLHHTIHHTTPNYTSLYETKDMSHDMTLHLKRDRAAHLTSIIALSTTESLSLRLHVTSTCGVEARVSPASGRGGMEWRGGGRGREWRRGGKGRGGEGMVEERKEGGIREREEREIEDRSRINHLLFLICYLIFIASHIQLEKWISIRNLTECTLQLHNRRNVCTYVPGCSCCCCSVIASPTSSSDRFVNTESGSADFVTKVTSALWNNPKMDFIRINF